MNLLLDTHVLLLWLDDNLIAQARSEGFTLVTGDPVFARHKTPRILA
jgi:PIN domain nuclease of toxin-antitoxin system